MVHIKHNAFALVNETIGKIIKNNGFYFFCSDNPIYNGLNFEGNTFKYAWKLGLNDEENNYVKIRATGLKNINKLLSKKAISKKSYISQTYKTTGYQIKSKNGYESVTLLDSMSNCKIKVIGGINTATMSILDFVCKKHSYIAFFATVTNVAKYNEIKKHFKLIYDIKVPIGYSNKNQYHILIKNPYQKKYDKKLF